jgi:hypothetical protein
MARMIGRAAFHVEHPFRAWLASGVAATAALGGYERLERALLGREPPYAPAAVAKRLLGDRRYGLVLRWLYGPALGVLYGALRSRWRIPPLAFGAVLAATELVAMPRVGATPELDRRETIALFAHACAFALAAGLALDQAARSASRNAVAV